MGWGSLLGGGGFSGITSGVSSTSSSSGGWLGALGGSGGSGGWGSFFGNLAAGFLGGGSGGGGSSGGNIWGQMLAGGINGYAQAGLSKEMIEIKGKEDRKSTAFEAQLVDYYKQLDKVRKRQALDTYGQFSTTNKWAPNATPPAPIQPNQYPQVG